MEPNDIDGCERLYFETIYIRVLAMLNKYRYIALYFREPVARAVAKTVMEIVAEENPTA